MKRLLYIILALALFLAGCAIPNEGDDTDMSGTETTDTRRVIELGENDMVVSPIFGDGMVLQMGKKITVFGAGVNSAEVKTRVVAALTKDGVVVGSADALVDDYGQWCVELEAIDKYGEGYGLEIDSPEADKSYRFTDIAIGELFLSAGQSNFERLNHAFLNEGQLERFNRALEGKVRIFDMFSTDAYGGRWVTVDRANVGYVSALAYYFAEDMAEELNCRVGVITAAVGGTSIAMWLPEQGRCPLRQGQVAGVNYESRIKPLTGLQVRAILWYQGEEEGQRTITIDDYAEDLTRLIGEYRALFGDVHFFNVGIMRYDQWLNTKTPEADYIKTDNVGFARVRAAQESIYRTDVEGYTLVGTLDLYGNYGIDNLIGELIYDRETGQASRANMHFTGNARTDVHPAMKSQVAERLSNAVLCELFGRDLPESMRVKSAAREGSELRLEFYKTGELSVMPLRQYADWYTERYLADSGVDPSVLCEFEVSADGDIWYDASARIDGCCVVLFSGECDAPRWARYAYKNYPECPNLTDGTGLPCLPFVVEAR